MVEKKYTEIPSSRVKILEGHQEEVYTCAWSPCTDLLASSAGDGTARIWKLNDQNENTVAIVLNHCEPGAKVVTPLPTKAEVTTVDWNVGGTLLATGFAGIVRIWTSVGQLHSQLNNHDGQIFALKWNKRGNYIVSGGTDRSTIIWDVATSACKQKFEFHSGPVLDIDWRTETSFASAGTDYNIIVCELDNEQPIKIFKGHTKTINCIKWNPSGELLASCSDDKMLKIWSLKQSTCLHNIEAHTKDIYKIQWSPTGAGTENVKLKPVLASAAFDSIIRIWDVDNANCLHSLEKHSSNIYSIAFSPDGKMLATGSTDEWIYIWNVQHGKLLYGYKTTGGILDLCWNMNGTKLSASVTNHTVIIINMKGL